MVMLIRKMFRDIWKNKVPFIAIFLMMLAGNFIFSGITCEYNGINKSFHSFVDKTNLADAWITSERFDKAKVNELESKSNILKIEKRLYLSSTLEHDKNKSVDFYVLDNQNSISKIAVADGEKYDTTKKGIWIDLLFAQENDYALHDKIVLNVNGQLIENEIIGLCYSPEYIYNVNEGEMLPNHQKKGFAFVNKSSIPDDVLSVPYNQLLINGTGNIEKTIEDIFGMQGISVIMQEDHPSYSMICDEVTQHKEIGLIFVAVFLFIAILITITTVHRLLNSQRMQIGILKALGFHKSKLYLHYVSHSTFACFVGAVIGWCIGYIIIPQLLYPTMEKMYVLPRLEPAVIQGSWCLPLVCVFLSFIVSIFICKKYLSDNASKILYSNFGEKAMKEISFHVLNSCLSFYKRWNIRDIFQNRLRSMMTIFGVIGCISLLFASMGLFTSMQNLTDWTFEKVQTFETKITGTFSDKKYKNKLLDYTFGEELMESSIVLKTENNEKTTSFTGIKSQNYIRLYGTNDKQVTLKNGVALSKNIADELSIQIGDRIRFRFSGTDKWYMSIVSEIIHTPMSQGITMMKSDMDKENIPFYTTSIIGYRPTNVKIDSDYVSNTQNKSDLKSGLDTMLDASVMLCSLFLFMAILLGSVILYNLGTLSYMERYRDMATLKVLGFNNKRLKKLMIQQNLWLTFIGVIIGLPVGYSLLLVMLGTVQASIDINVYTPYYVYLASLLGTFLLSWLINKLIAQKIKNIDMVSALKVNE